MEKYIKKAEYKKGKNLQPKLPIPKAGDPQSDDWPIYYGRLEGTYVTVDDTDEASILFKQGFFGRSSHSYKSNNKELVEKRLKFGRKKDWQEETNTTVKLLNNEENSNKNCHTTWLLTFEEALFLSYALGVLVVSLQSNQLMTIDDMWRTFTIRRSSFPIQYAVYHHFRSRNWIVRNGLKAGCNWALYPDGPPFSHAQFLVWVKCIWDDEGDACKESNRSYSLVDLTALERIAGLVSKNLILCTVIRPRSVTDELIKDMDCLQKLHVTETIMTRWNAEQV